MSHWSKRRVMNLTNRGLETVVSEEYLPATDTWRVTKIERMMGSVPTTTYDRILGHPESFTEFQHLCTEALAQEFDMPESTIVGEVFDLKDAEGE